MNHWNVSRVHVIPQFKYAWWSHIRLWHMQLIKNVGLRIKLESNIVNNSLCTTCGQGVDFKIFYSHELSVLWECLRTLLPWISTLVVLESGLLDFDSNNSDLDLGVLSASPFSSPLYRQESRHYNRLPPCRLGIKNDTDAPFVIRKLKSHLL